MSEMKYVNLTANGQTSLGNSALDLDKRGGAGKLFLMLSNNFGGGSVALQKYSVERSAWITIATISSAMTEAESFEVGKAETRLDLTGATSPDIDGDYWWK